MILMGDMNINLLKNSNTVKDYLLILSSYGYVSLINQPTRVTPKIVVHA